MPEKIEMFLWRPSLEILPCTANLVKTKKSWQFRRDAHGVEKQMKLLFFAKQMWDLTPLLSVLSTWRERCFMDLMEYGA